MCLSIALRRPDDVLKQGEHLGFEWMIIHNRCGYRCGYVRIPLGHPWHGASDRDLYATVSVHGGLKFAEADVPCDQGGADNAWWIGFDCAHYNDAADPSLPIDPELYAPLVIFGVGEIRTTEYVEAECLSLCEQAAESARSQSATSGTCHGQDARR